jgi:ACR3 family arsenite transporter
MSTDSAPEALPQIGFFARYLSLWVALCIVAGITLGHAFPQMFALLATLQLQQINLPVAVLVWLMIVPMLLKVDFTQLGAVRRQVRGIGITLLVNWAIKPFSMALLAWLFIRHVFAA